MNIERDMQLVVQGGGWSVMPPEFFLIESRVQTPNVHLISRMKCNQAFITVPKSLIHYHLFCTLIFIVFMATIAWENESYLKQKLNKNCLI